MIDTNQQIFQIIIGFIQYAYYMGYIGYSSFRFFRVNIGRKKIFFSLCQSLFLFGLIYIISAVSTSLWMIFGFMCRKKAVNFWVEDIK